MGRHPLAKHYDKVKQLDITARQERVWSMLASGKTYRQMAAVLDVSVGTIANDVATVLSAVQEVTHKTAEQWLANELSIIEQKIAECEEDANFQPVPRLDKHGEPIPGHWDVTPGQAAKTRNMARVTMLKWMERRQKLLGMDIDRSQVQVDQRVMVAVVKGDGMIEAL